MVRARGDSLTGDLLSWEPPKVAAGFEPGTIRGNRLASQISQAVALALKQSELSRAEIAAAMSAELGYPISENMLANYAAEGSESHKISLERFLALIEVTGCVDLLGFVVERFGHVAVPQKFADIIEWNLIEEHEADVARHKQSVAARMHRWKR